MSYAKRIEESQWKRIYEYLQAFTEIYVCNEEACRQFVEAAFWMARSGSQWRLLPPEFVHWNTIYRRFSDWAKQGICCKMLYYFAQEPDMEYILVDSTILRLPPKKLSRARRLRPFLWWLFNENPCRLWCPGKPSSFYGNRRAKTRRSLSHPVNSSVYSRALTGR